MVNMVRTLVNNNIHQHSGQNLLQTNEGEHLTTVMTIWTVDLSSC